MTTILLARHGETDWNREGRFQGHADPSLNELGRQQAQELAATLVGVPIDVLYSSDLRRAVETAEIVGRRVGLRPTLLGDLREADVGELTGLTRDEIAERFPQNAALATEHGYTFASSGESFDVLSQRVIAAIESIAAMHREQRILVVTHGGPMRAILARADGMSLADHRRAHPPAANCGLYEIRVESGRMSRLD